MAETITLSACYEIYSAKFNKELYQWEQWVTQLSNEEIQTKKVRMDLMMRAVLCAKPRLQWEVILTMVTLQSKLCSLGTYSSRSEWIKVRCLASCYRCNERMLRTSNNLLDNKLRYLVF